ncbi:hypothetical protein MNBD_BACTEROID01-1355 [hydrothermal vent metagenome]|uniref:Uncharacterized protein n=1 Tax=hydrothermal vent metagenome TaxID=652676 RepID=A0A3B0TC97_9ZZZZ
MRTYLHKIYIITLISIVVAVFIYLAVNGSSYYLSGPGHRFHHGQHNILKSSGFIGHGLGIVGSLAMFIGVFGYMARKRIRRFLRLGALKYWLEFHIFLCSLGPVLVLFHTAFKFGGIVAISFWSMVAVVISGIIGRFIYIQIPRTIEGQELSLNEINALRSDFYSELKFKFSLKGELIEKLNFELNRKLSLEGVNYLIRIPKRFSFEKKIIRKIKKELKGQQLSRRDYNRVVRMYKKGIVLNRRIDWLSSMQDFLRYWHVLHLPFAIILLVILIIHVSIAVTFGYKWIF